MSGLRCDGPDSHRDCVGLGCRVLVFVGVACISFTVVCVYAQISALIGSTLGLKGLQYMRAGTVHEGWYST